MTIVESRAVTGGVDTHQDVHVAAALDGIGGLLGVEEFSTTPAGYAELLGWLRQFGAVELVGIEGTGSYGAGLARFMHTAGVRVVEVDRSDRQDRRRQGKSDPLDAVSAARAALSGRARGAPKGRDGAVEAIRALMVAKRSARSERTRPSTRQDPLSLLALTMSGPGSPNTPPQRWWPTSQGCGPGQETPWATPLASPCGSWAGGLSSSTTRSTGSTN